MITAFYFQNNISGSLIFVNPITVDSQHWGCLALVSNTNKTWTDIEKQNIQTLSNFLGILYHRLEQERKITDALNESKKADQIKADFLAQMSHEIRTPLNSILSFIQLLKSDLRKNEQGSFNDIFNLIDRGGKRLIRTIDMNLQMAEIQSNSYDINPKELLIDKRYLENIVFNYNTEIEDKKVKVIITNTADQFEINSDENAVYHIINNIVGNAVKFTPEGTIKLNISNNGSKSVSIEDSGIGISKDYLPNIFLPYSQEESGYTRTYEGNGLGLAIAKNYSKYIGANIIVETEKNKGSKFTITFENLD